MSLIEKDEFRNQTLRKYFYNSQSLQNIAFMDETTRHCGQKSFFKNNYTLIKLLRLTTTLKQRDVSLVYKFPLWFKIISNHQGTIKLFGVIHVLIAVSLCTSHHREDQNSILRPHLHSDQDEVEAETYEEAAQGIVLTPSWQSSVQCSFADRMRRGNKPC